MLQRLCSPATLCAPSGGVVKLKKTSGRRREKEAGLAQEGGYGFVFNE